MSWTNYVDTRHAPAGSKKLTTEQRERLVGDYRVGIGVTELAYRYGVGRSTIYAILRDTSRAVMAEQECSLGDSILRDPKLYALAQRLRRRPAHLTPAHLTPKEL